MSAGCDPALRCPVARGGAPIDPTIEDSYRKEVVVDGETLLLDILDTAGGEEYPAERDQHLRACDGVLIVYSIAFDASFQEVPSFHGQILRTKTRSGCRLSSWGTARSGAGAGGRDGGRAKGAQWGAPFMETSAKMGINVEDVFVGLVREIRRMAG